MAANPPRHAGYAASNAPAAIHAVVVAAQRGAGVRPRGGVGETVLVVPLRQLKLRQSNYLALQSRCLTS